MKVSHSIEDEIEEVYQDFQDEFEYIAPPEHEVGPLPDGNLQVKSIDLQKVQQNKEAAEESTLKHGLYAKSRALLAQRQLQDKRKLQPITASQMRTPSFDRNYVLRTFQVQRRNEYYPPMAIQNSSAPPSPMRHQARMSTSTIKIVDKAAPTRQNGLSGVLLRANSISQAGSADRNTGLTSSANRKHQPSKSLVGNSTAIESQKNSPNHSRLPSRLPEIIPPN